MILKYLVKLLSALVKTFASYSYSCLLTLANESEVAYSEYKLSIEFMSFSFLL